MCPEGQKCCISRDSNDDKIPSNVIIPNKNNNFTRVTPSSTTRKPITTTDSLKTPFPPKPPVLKQKPCPGECLNGFFVIFCDDIDPDAYCPGEGSCCISQVSVVPQLLTPNIETVTGFRQMMIT